MGMAGYRVASNCYTDRLCTQPFPSKCCICQKSLCTAVCCVVCTLHSRVCVKSGKFKSLFLLIFGKLRVVMPSAIVLLSTGAEEMETVITVDVLRRGGVRYFGI